MAFDRAATTYDTIFTHSPTARWLRQRTWERLDRLFMPGMRVLEIGCGTGEDAVHLAQRGIDVVATDSSPQMIAQTQQKAAAAGIPITCRLFDLNQPQQWALEEQFDGVYSNFGALNCTNRWGELSAWLAKRLPVGGRAAWGVMGRFCLWETVWHGLRGEWRIAARRWRGHNQANLPDGSTFGVYYPSPAALRRATNPAFRQTALLGLGVFLPSSDIYPIIESRPRLQGALTGLESRCARFLPWAADHFWMELERV